MNIIEFVFKQDNEHKTLLNVPIKGLVKNHQEWLPRNNAKRLNQETGIYNNKPNDPEYVTTYYHEKNKRY